MLEESQLGPVCRVIGLGETFFHSFSDLVERITHGLATHFLIAQTCASVGSCRIAYTVALGRERCSIRNLYKGLFGGGKLPFSAQFMNKGQAR